MKLNIVPARTGLLWVKLGFKTFFRQPLALSGLFFLSFAALTLASQVPLIGIPLAIALLPAANLALMVAAEQSSLGKFPMPTVLVSAFRAERQRIRDMIVLGVLYAIGFLFVIWVPQLIGGDQFDTLAVMTGKLPEEVIRQPRFQIAAVVKLLLSVPLSLMFWHAPALVHWHGISPVKSLFFSFIACCKNFGAITVFTLAWAGVFMASSIIVAPVMLLTQDPSLLTAAISTLVMIMMTIFLTSIYFTFRDSFVNTLPDTDSSDSKPSDA